MIEELFPGEYRAAKREVAAAIASDAPSSLAGSRRSCRNGESRRRGAGREDRRGAAHRQGDADGRGEHAVLQRRQGGRRMVTVRRENTTCDIRGIGAYGIIVAQESEPGDGFRRDAGNEPQRKKPQTAVS